MIKERANQLRFKMKILIANTLLMCLIYVNNVKAQSSVSNSSESSSVASFGNLIILGEILDVFDIRNVGANWSSISKRLTNSCSTEMEYYLRGLQAGKIWAVKSKCILSSSITSLFQ